MDKIIDNKNYTLFEMVEMAKKSEYGALWYSEKGPIQITKEGKLEPLFNIYATRRFKGINDEYEEN